MSGENILKGCLVESDPATIARERQAKRRALVVAIILQVLLVGLLVLAPLLGAVEKLPNNISIIFSPRVPYKGGPKESGPKHDKQQTTKKTPTITNKPPIYQPRSIPPNVADIHDPPEVFAAQPQTGGNTGQGSPDGVFDLDSPGERSAMVPKPPETKPQPKLRTVVSEGVQAARLVLRVDPKYPSLPRSAGIEGKVVLRAIIAKDGTIQSLEVMRGDALFVLAAREAIAQWRYQPTMLNGEAVEVETVITVVFTLRR